MKASNEPLPFLSGKMISRFEAIQNCLVPRSRTFTSEEQSRSQSLVNTVLAQQDKIATKKLALFITLIDVFSLAFHARSFRNISTKKQTSIMNLFFDSPIPILRKGFWGLNTLARLGVYGQKKLHEEIGYILRENT